MRLGFGLGLAAGRGRATVALLLAGTALTPIARRWLDTAAWDDTSIWSESL